MKRRKATFETIFSCQDKRKVSAFIAIYFVVSYEQTWYKMMKVVRKYQETKGDMIEARTKLCVNTRVSALRTNFANAKVNTLFEVLIKSFNQSDYSTNTEHPNQL